MEAFTGTGLACFFALFHAAVPFEKAFAFEIWTKFGIDIDQSTGNTEFDRSDLAGDPTSVSFHVNVVLLVCLGNLQWFDQLIL